MSAGSLKIIRNFDDPFTHIENSILRDKRMSLAERGFFALILSLPKNREMTLAYFSRVSGANKETVGKYFHKLEELGYLRRYRERGEHGVFGSTIYEFTTSGISPCTDLPCMVEPDTAEPCTVNPTVKNKSIINTPIAPKGGEREKGLDKDARDDAERALLFDRFYALYPRKVGKQAARRAWEKLKPDLLLCSQMSQALKRQIASEEWQRDGGRYIPHPSTWLNGRRWEDEPTTPTTQQQPTHPKKWVGVRIVDGQEVDIFE